MKFRVAPTFAKAMVGKQKVFTEKNRFRVAQKVFILNDKQQVLLVRFSKNHPRELQGKWDFPGGGLLWEESLEKGLIRELKEELGKVDIEVGEPVVVWDFLMKEDKSVRTVCVGYKAFWRKGTIKLNEEHDKYEWVHLWDLGKYEWDKEDGEMVKKLPILLERGCGCC